MRNPCLTALLGASLLLTCPALLEAQTNSNPTGFHLGLYSNAAAIAYDAGTDTESGAGAGLALGWGLSRNVTVFGQLSGTAIQLSGSTDTYTLAHWDLGARFHFRGPRAKALPYLVAAYSGRSASLDLGGSLFTVTGAGPSFGGGVAVFLKRALALDFGLLLTTGSFTEADYLGATQTIDEGAVSTRFNMGISWWAGR